MTELKVKQEMYPQAWSEFFLRSHENFAEKVRKGKVDAPVQTLEYGYSGGNPYGVGASSLTKEVRNWWYGRKAYPKSPTPADYTYTAEQGRMMEIPAVFALREMGFKVETQVEAKGPNYGGFADGILYEPLTGRPPCLLELKHLGRIRYLNMFWKPLSKEFEDYFWQSQAYMCALDLQSTLFVITSQDASSVRTELYKKSKPTKKEIEYAEKNELPPPVPPPLPNVKAFAFKIGRLEGAEKYIMARAEGMMKTLEWDTPPHREADINEHWLCEPAFCPWRSICLTAGKEGGIIAQMPQVEVEQIYL